MVREQDREGVFDPERGLVAYTGTSGEIEVDEASVVSGYVEDEYGNRYAVVDGQVIVPNIHGTPGTFGETSGEPFDLTVSRQGSTIATTFVGHQDDLRRLLMGTGITGGTVPQVQPMYDPSSSMAHTYSQSDRPEKPYVHGQAQRRGRTVASTILRELWAPKEERSISRKLGIGLAKAALVSSVVFPAATFWSDEPAQFVRISEFPNPHAMFRDPINGVENLSGGIGAIKFFGRFVK